MERKGMAPCGSGGKGMIGGLFRAADLEQLMSKNTRVLTLSTNIFCTVPRQPRRLSSGSMFHLYRANAWRCQSGSHIHEGVHQPAHRARVYRSFSREINRAEF